MKIKITAIRKVQYEDLMAQYENPIEHTCDVCEGQSWISIDGHRPEGLCPEAWKSMREFVEALGALYDVNLLLMASVSAASQLLAIPFYILSSKSNLTKI